LHSRNRWIHLLKNHQWRTLVLTAPALLAYEAVWVAFTFASGTFGGYCEGKFALLRWMPSIFREREKAQRARCRRDRDLLVGGPLTVAPQLGGSSLRASLLRALDTGLRAWWALVRTLC
jgi:hypothetical protein